MANTLHGDLFSSLISDIKTYTGKDPLLPWLRGIRKMMESLPPQLLKEKLPRFLQKCAQTFETDRRYTNDMRYLRVWLQLMDFVDDPRGLLRTMEINHIGEKRALFYQAYALYYEKIKKFEEADKMYHLGVQNLAEPLEELQKSYEQFLHRLERHKNRRIQRQEGRKTNKPPARVLTQHCGETKENNENMQRVERQHTGTWPEESSPKTLHNHKSAETNNVSKESSHDAMPMEESNRVRLSEKLCDGGTDSIPSLKKEVITNIEPVAYSNQQEFTETKLDRPSTFCEDPLLVKFLDTAVVGKSEAEDACHHGLVEPTINMKEAMNAINNMFREPLEPAMVGRATRRRPRVDNSLNNGFKVFVDENLDNESFNIFIDEEEANGVGDRNDEKDHLEEESEVQDGTEDSGVNVFVFPSPKDDPSESSDNLHAENSSRPKFREDTVVCRFVGSTILDEPEVENVCHHGLVEPTINLKEAMNDINNMFGKPIEFARKRRPKKQDKVPDTKRDFGGGFSILPDDDLESQKGFSILPDNDLASQQGFSILPDNDLASQQGFSILPDDDLESQQGRSLPKSSHKSREFDLSEPTVFTKEAMDEINKMFGMPLDF
uniref:BUB1 N-terminal domain-containing protein n=1 Tax=Vitis vinifera TaxID=29760 RepID=F6HC91_VITVI